MNQFAADAISVKRICISCSPCRSRPECRTPHRCVGGSLSNQKSSSSELPAAGKRGGESLFDHGVLPSNNTQVNDALVVRLALRHATGGASQQMANVRLTPFRGGHPMPHRPWRIMADVLLMPTLQFCHPVQLLIHVEANNFSWHTFTLLLRLHHLLSGRGRSEIIGPVESASRNCPTGHSVCQGGSLVLLRVATRSLFSLLLCFVASLLLHAQQFVWHVRVRSHVEIFALQPKRKAQQVRMPADQ